MNKRDEKLREIEEACVMGRQLLEALNWEAEKEVIHVNHKYIEAIKTLIDAVERKI